MSENRSPTAVVDVENTALTSTTKSTLIARILVTLVQSYQVIRGNRVSPCRFTPTCSQYAVEALSRHGTRRGLRLTVSRLGRCRPRGPFGADPVPE